MIPKKIADQFNEFLQSLPSKERGIVTAYIYYVRKLERECFAIEINQIVERLRCDDISETNKDKEKEQN